MGYAGGMAWSADVVLGKFDMRPPSAAPLPDRTTLVGLPVCAAGIGLAVGSTRGVLRFSEDNMDAPVLYRKWFSHHFIYKALIIKQNGCKHMSNTTHKTWTEGKIHGVGHCHTTPLGTD